ncbi:amidohydrolase family protein [Segnochrobactraceae bacterium EtOH-i3]
MISAPVSGPRAPSPRTILANASAILTGLSGSAARASGDIAIADGRISAIGAVARRPDDRVVDVSGSVIYPGLVSTHHHLNQSVLKAIPGGLDAALPEWLVRVPYTFWNHIDADAFTRSVELGMVELLLSGVTTIADHHYIFDAALDYDPAAILFDVAGRLGVRFLLARGGATLNSRMAADGLKRVPAESVETILDRVAALAARFHDPAPDARRRVALAPTNLVWSVTPEHMAELAAGGRALGLRLHSHLSEGAGDVTACLERYGQRPVEMVAAHGFTGPDVWLAHLIHIDDRERAILTESGTTLAHCPQSNARLGAGIAAAPAFAAAGGRVSLGVDGAASNEAADMINEMHAAWLLHRAIGGPDALPVEEVVRWASANGADALGFAETGRLEPGRLADIAVFDVSGPRHAGVHDLAVAPVVCGGGTRVRHLFVGGEAVVSDGRVVGSDLPAVLAGVAESVARLKAQTGARG